jgi:hypothetical protein
MLFQGGVWIRPEAEVENFPLDFLVPLPNQMSRQGNSGQVFLRLLGRAGLPEGTGAVEFRSDGVTFS